jgi:hypothetical protein
MYRTICSLGPNCHAAQIMKRLNWKQESHPFDWIFSSPAIILDCLKDRFEKFLDTQYYLRDSGCEGNTHSHYFQDTTLTMFNHYNPLRPEHSDYYRRCITRFYEVLENTNPKLFLFMFVDKKTYIDERIDQKVNRVYATTVDDILHFEKEFRKYTDNYKIVCIFQSIGDERRVLFTHYKNVDIIDLETLSKSGGNYFLDDNDNIFLDGVLREKYC